MVPESLLPFYCLSFFFFYHRKAGLHFLFGKLHSCNILCSHFHLQSFSEVQNLSLFDQQMSYIHCPQGEEYLKSAVLYERVCCGSTEHKSFLPLLHLLLTVFLQKRTPMKMYLFFFLPLDASFTSATMVFQTFGTKYIH